ncbi:hypothetical protein [Cupriavidus metallidurans]
MDIEALRMTLQQPSLASLGVGFLLGFVFTFNPVALASIPGVARLRHEGA